MADPNCPACGSHRIFSNRYGQQCLDCPWLRYNRSTLDMFARTHDFVEAQRKPSLLQRFLDWVNA